VTGFEIAVGYLFAWAVRQVRRARRVAGPADAEVDRELAVGMDRLHSLVSRYLGQDPAFRRVHEEAAAGQQEPSLRTCRRLELALEDAAERDADFAVALREAVTELQALPYATAARSAKPGAPQQD